MGLWAYCSARVEQPSTVPANEVSLNIRRFLAGQRLKDRVLVFSHHRSHFECRRWISVSLAFEDIALIGFGFTFDALDYTKFQVVARRSFQDATTRTTFPKCWFARMTASASATSSSGKVL